MDPVLLRAAAVALLGYATLAMLDSSAKWLALAGLPLVQIAFVRYAVHLAIVSALHLPSQGRGLWRSGMPGLALLRGVALMAGSLCNFMALRYLPLTVTGAIAFTMPLMVCLISALALGERLRGAQWLAILSGFGGILIVTRPGGEAFHPAVLLSLAAAALNAVYFVITRKLSETDAVSTQQFISAATATLIALPFAVMTDWAWPPDPAGWLALALLGICGFLGHQFVTFAHGLAPASFLAPVAYLQIFFLAVFGWLLFRHLPDLWFLAGAPVICLSSWYLIRYGRAPQTQSVQRARSVPSGAPLPAERRS